MINIKYKWHSLRPIYSIEGKRFEALLEVDMPDKHVDNNFFKSKDDAVKWLQERIDEEPTFAEEDTLILTEMFFT